MNNEAIDLLFEVRELLENGDNPINDIQLTTRIINHTNDYVQRSRLRSNGAAHRDRLIAAKLDVRSES